MGKLCVNLQCFIWLVLSPKFGSQFYGKCKVSLHNKRGVNCLGVSKGGKMSHKLDNFFCVLLHLALQQPVHTFQLIFFFII